MLTVPMLHHIAQWSGDGGRECYSAILLHGDSTFFWSIRGDEKFEAVPEIHSHAIVIAQAFGRLPEEENLAYAWCDGLEETVAEFRAFEVAIAISEHIQYMGFSATAHDRDTGDVDVDRLSVLSGVALREGTSITNPYLGEKFAVAVVTTDYELEIDLPLHASAKRAKGLGYWMGEPHTRQGYAFEAVSLIVPFVFKTLGLHRLEAACIPDNKASCGLLHKLGFYEEGCARGYLQIDGEWRDHILFALLKDDWPVGGLKDKPTPQGPVLKGLFLFPSIVRLIVKGSPAGLLVLVLTASSFAQNLSLIHI